MTILKNGKILKETYYFECPSCDCHWTANYNEVKRYGSSASIYVMRCPQCLRQNVEAKYVNYDPTKINADPYVKACIEAEEAASYINSSVKHETDTSDSYARACTECEKTASYINASASAYNSYYNNIPISTNTHP